MTSEIELDLTGTAPARKTKAVKPTLGESLYAQRLVAGQHPEVSLDDETVNEGVREAMAEIVAAQQHADVITTPNDRDLINQLLGQAQAFNAAGNLLQTFGVSKLAFVKENKLYKALSDMRAPNGLELKGTWVEFCNLLGISDEKANTDIANLNTFGQEALESMTRMGIGYRDLAQYRKLPDDEKTALIEAAKSGDKDQLLDLAESLIEKHIKEKSELTAKTEELEKDLKDSGKRANNMNAEIERLEMQNERLAQKKERLTKFEPYTEDVRDECMHLQAGCEFNLASLDKLFHQVFYAENTPEQQLRVEQVYIAVTAAASNALLMIETMRELMPELPDRVQGQHILTPAEAERWLHDYPMIENKHNAGQIAREVKRDADKPKGRGRPAGSKNKAED